MLKFKIVYPSGKPGLIHLRNPFPSGHIWWYGPFINTRLATGWVSSTSIIISLLLQYVGAYVGAVGDIEGVVVGNLLGATVGEVLGAVVGAVYGIWG